MKTIIVTGACGNLGQYLIKFLQELKEEFRIIACRKFSHYQNEDYLFDKSKVIFETCNFEDNTDVINLIVKYKPDYFFNLAGIAKNSICEQNPEKCFKQNTSILVKILNAIQNYSPSCRFFNAGSIYEFDYNKQNFYSLTKKSASLIVNHYRKKGIYAVIGFLPHCESELRDESYLTKKIILGVKRAKMALEAGLEFEPIQLGNLDEKMNFFHCEDIVEGIWRIVNQEVYNSELKNELDKYWLNGKGDWKSQEISFLSRSIKNYVLSNGENHSIREFVELAFKEINIDNLSWEGKGFEEKLINFPRRGWLFKHSKEFVVINREIYKEIDSKPEMPLFYDIEKDLGWKPRISFEYLVKKLINNN